MKKEILIAILIGFILGLVITFGIWTANKSLQENTQTQNDEVNDSKPIVTEPVDEDEKISLIISSPENNSLTNQAKIEIIGRTTALATVVILYEEGEEIIQADEKGEFNQEITLVGGANEIKITAFDNKGNEANKILNLVYSSAEI